MIRCYYKSSYWLSLLFIFIIKFFIIHENMKQRNIIKDIMCFKIFFIFLIWWLFLNFLHLVGFSCICEPNNILVEVMSLYEYLQNTHMKHRRWSEKESYWCISFIQGKLYTPNRQDRLAIKFTCKNYTPTKEGKFEVKMHSVIFIVRYENTRQIQRHQFVCLLFKYCLEKRK